ncbi:MAG: exopolysaccharide biosynthesis polyprenyl glycosylphosphotransferase [Solirubrobacterales bacterium]|nr:exopolysaccharide biosynthesis polyprenyl glycosylphosphotransferase [Solirubrobacterales bacterium]
MLNDGPPTVEVDPAGSQAARRPRFWRDALRRRLLALADLIAAAAASVVVASSSTHVFWALVLLPAWVLIAKLVGLYDRDHVAIRHLTVDELAGIAAWAGAGVALLALVLPQTPAGEISPGSAVVAWLVATGAAMALRSAARWIWRRATPPEVTAVLGAGDLAEMIRRKLELFPDMHLRLIGDADTHLPFDEVADEVDRVIFAADVMEPGEVGGLVALCRERQVKLSVISPLHGRAGPVRLSRVADLPVLEYETWDPSRSTAMIKRGFDIAVSSVGLLITAPLFPLIALAVRLGSPGPVFFSQARAGLDGRPFEMHKFRTMVIDAEDRLADVIRLDDLRDPVFKLSDDPRVTRVGRLLRRLSLDELPQLYNVLRGEMSIVGPRPEQIELVERYRPEHRFRLSVKPGITGPMQVFGRGDLTFHERLAVELDYIENLSLARDLRIIAETVPVALRGSGAY